MRRLFDGRVGMAFAMVVIFAAMVIMAAGYPATARFLPLVIGIPGLMLATLQLAIEIRRAAREPVPQAAAAPADVGGDGGDPRTRLRREGTLFLYLVGLVAAILLLGFVIAAPLFVATFLWLREHESPRVIAMGSFATLAVLYVVFEVLLELSLYRGHLLELLSG